MSWEVFHNSLLFFLKVFIYFAALGLELSLMLARQAFLHLDPLHQPPHPFFVMSFSR
jgi:hypothetical protein